MVSRNTLGWIIPLIFSFNVWAENISLNPSHPSQYTVVAGDTLWDIAAKFLQKPAQWSQIWEANPAIKNPNLIYPGDLLGFSMQNGKPRVSVLKRNQAPSQHAYTSNYQRFEKLSPQIHESSLNEAIPLLPATAIDQFLSSPKVVNPGDLDTAPYVLSFAGEHLVGGSGDRVYVRAITENNGTNYTIFRQGKAYINPEDNQILGYDAEFIANTTLQIPGDPATLIINKAKSEVRAGDRLMANDADELTLNYFPRSPEKPIHASIISVLDGVSQIGQYNTVVLNKGKADDLAVGHVLEISQRGKIVPDPFAAEKNATVILPDDIAGSLMVYRVFEHVAYALVMKASQPIHILDKAQSP